MYFTKMHGIGNDYIYINCLEQTVGQISEYAKLLSDRHFGVGSDGVILICPSEIADFKMEIYNSDGTQAQMCGNGIRCVGKYVYDNHLTHKTELSIETLAGIKNLQLHITQGKVISVTVDMGVPIFATDKIPVNLTQNFIINYPYTLDRTLYNITCVSMGNPHTIVFMDSDIDDFEVCKVGPRFENSDLFPERTNVEFATVIDENNIKMRVWERGVGETLACGTGACAVACAAIVNGLCDRLVNVHLPGGKLHIAWDEVTDHIYMTGSATKIFDGEIN